MYRIIDKRGTGKTSRLLLLAKENNGIVVCADPRSAREKSYAYGLVGIDFMSYIEYIDRTEKIDRPIYIDDIEGFMSCYTCNTLGGYTLSED